MVKVKKVEGVESGLGKRVILIDGVKYVADYEKSKRIDGIEHTDKIIFKKFDEERYEKDMKIVIDCLKNKTTTEELLSQILKDIDMKDLRKLAKRIKDKKPIRKHKGCLGFKIGDAYVQLVE
ncbi:hypothetical protein LCGC14_0462150 [marine sediment metagenome]|uniref:Uncharacterized protein n=1 Tax=marine sediment metagenome TaxID=412755 RepID=A0A0F9V1G6_9ZZZZ